MTGLNLEPFLRLLRADVGAWASLGAIAFLLALAVWTGWGSRRVLRKGLVLSVLAHVGLVLFGGEDLARWMSPGLPGGMTAPDEGIRSIRLSSVGSLGGVEAGQPLGGLGSGRGAAADLDLAGLDLPAPADPILRASRPAPVEGPEAGPTVPIRPDSPALAEAAPSPMPEVPGLAEERPPQLVPEADPVSEVVPAEVDLSEVAAPAPAERAPEGVAPPPLPEPDRLASRPPGQRSGREDETSPRVGPAEPLPRLDEPEPPALTVPDPPRFRPEAEPDRRFASGGPEPTVGRPRTEPIAPDSDAVPAPRGLEQRNEPPPLGLPEADLRAMARPRARPEPGPASETEAGRASPGLVPELDRVVPGAVPDRPGLEGPGGGRALLEVPEVYRSRLDPNRSDLARRAGASSASEEAVERALDWLARHQDEDGRWDAGTARYRDGSAAPGEDSFTTHCPPGDICPGECYYWEADTALTGLALLAFLGSGYTQTEGKYAPVVGRGIDFLVRSQKPDGDLRGTSKAVGMYCHTMAALALSEAYAMSGDPELRGPVERAVAFLEEAQYPGRMGWRYAPGGEIAQLPAEDGRGLVYAPHPPVGDTSVLGWVVMVLKSASEVGVPVSPASLRSARDWLSRVADGHSGGLARYQPTRPPDPVMTAEAWACRQFLGLGGPGPASSEAAAELLGNLPTAKSYNSYFWYYATLAMYQHGGPSWERWNASIRDTLVGLQRRDGHRSGSWDPDPTRYGTHGGRVYATALATLTLEVYYRYLRLYAPEGGAVGIADPLRPGGGVERAGADAVR
ncbi:prenyltransferase/squalene oxidase repeat-containing protein [Tautonia sociabilis]|uniref:Squalene cyclase C-terminal domain-containing protein n=1 Tax=Tautonia sociabilis TaxID=2080755 RepID=A0A432MQI2_9BACT|nr:prenyltransferase/squalene oxidase repeat-containing protein [Tautonia sociabilis]RUL89620.1 hypothetical protein TsocGM_00150 [Tautonia sociabilis]